MANEEELTPAGEEEVTEPQETSEPETTAEEKTQSDEKTQPEEEPVWKSRYRSPDDMFEDIRRLQSKADTLEAELRKQGVQMQAPVKPKAEERLEYLAQDPDKFVEEKLAGVEARLVLNEFLNEHPEYKPYKNQVVQSLGNNIGVLSNPLAVEMAFTYIKTKAEESKMKDAMKRTEEHQKKVEGVKKKDAYVEKSAVTSKRETPTIKPGMSVKEMEKVLDELGIREEEY